MLIDFLQNHRYIGYLAVFLGMIFEGDIFLFTAAFLTHQGFFDVGYMLLAMFSGVTLGDLGWFTLGIKIKKNHSKNIVARWVTKLSQPADQHLTQRMFRILFFSKFTYGIHHAILVRAGNLNLDRRQFLKKDFMANIFWIAIVGGLGFASSASYFLIRHYLKVGEITLVGLLIIFYLIWYLVGYETTKKLKRG